MTDASKNASPEPPKKKKRIGLKIFLGLIAVLLILIALLPTIASSGFARNLILTKVNEAVDGEVGLEKIKLSWFGGQKVSGIQFTDPTGHKVAAVKSVDISSGLLGIASSKNLGTITIQDADIDLPPPPEKAETPVPPPGDGEQADPTSKPAPKPKPSETEAPAEINIPVTGTLVIKNARVALASEQLLSMELATIDFAPDKPITFDLSAVATQGAGAIAAKGNIELPQGAFDIEKLPLAIDADIKNLNLEPILAFAGANPAVPKGSGTINGRFTITGNPLKVDARLDAHQLAFSGGPFGTDKPSFDLIKVELQGGLSGGAPQLQNLVIESPVLNAQGSGDLQTIQVKAQLLLPELASRFPDTLKLKEGMTIQNGRLDLASTIEIAGDQQDIKGSLRLNGLNGVLDGAEVKLEKPVIVTVDASVAPNFLDIRDFLLDASFIKANAKGNLEAMSVTLQADLPAAMTEVRSFVDTGGWDATGTADLDGSIAPGDGAQKKIAAVLNLNDFSVSRSNATVIANETINLNLTAAGDTAAGTFSDVTLAYSALMSKGRLLASGIRLPKKDAGIVVDSFSLEVGVNLLNLNPILQHLAGMPGDARVDGKVVLKCAGNLPDQAVKITKLDFSGEGLAYNTPEQLIAEKSLTLATQVDMDLKASSLTLTDLKLSATPGTVSSTSLKVGNLENPLPTLAGNLQASFDIAALTKVAQTKKPETPPAKTEGQLTTVIAMTPGKPISANIRVSNFAQELADGKKLEEPMIALKADIQVDPKGERLDIPDLTLTTSPISLTGALNLTDLKGEQNLTFRGTQTADMPRIAEYVKFFADQDIVMEGKETRPVQIKMSLAGKEPAELMGAALIQASLHADRIELYGLEIKDLEIPLNVTNGVTKVSLSAKLNQGSVAAAPYVLWKEEKPAIRFPTNSAILQDVQLTDKLANELLGLIHPIFRGASVAGGTVTLKLNNFEWPIEKGNETGVFDGVIELRDVKLASSGLLGAVLSVAGIKERAADLGNKDITFASKDGWITTNPMKIKVEGQQIELGGAIKVTDQTLDYAAKVPLGRELLGDSVAKYVGTNMFVNVPIGGTATSPRVDSGSVKQEVSRVIKSAGLNAGLQGLQGLLGGKKEDPAKPGDPNQVKEAADPNKPKDGTQPAKTTEEQLIEDGLKIFKGFLKK